MLHLTDSTTVVIIGPPGSGKSHVGFVLAESSGLPIYSTDAYLTDGHVAALYAIMASIGDEGWIVEGMIGYRLLRKRKELGMPAPDIVIQLTATDEQIENAYVARKQKCDIKKIRAFCKAHDVVLDEYRLMDGDEPQIWIHAKSMHLCHLIGGGPHGTASSDSST